MGGGDLNSKKAWHPNNMKNQERVWKAEQAAAEEKKRILELERERAQERDREELNKLTRRNTLTKNDAHNDPQLHWMYDKPDKKVQNEDYLLGKAIEKNYDSGTKAELNEIPAVSRRVVGSSMNTASENVQVDLARKLREDPLLLVKERERAARAALLNNPVQRRKLTELLRKEQEQRKSKSESNPKKKKKSHIDEMLTAKLSALGGGKVDLAKLLASDSSSSDSSSEEERKKSKKKKKKKDKKKKKEREKYVSDSGSSYKKKEKTERSRSTEVKESSRYSNEKYEKKFKEGFSSSSKKRHADYDSFEGSYKNNKILDREPQKEDKCYRDSSNSDYHKKDKYVKKPFDNRKKRVGLSEEEKAAKLAEMTAAGKEREVERGERVAKQLLEMSADDTATRPRSSKLSEARALPDSLEDRIHSNRHYIQRDRRHMNENFARR